MSRQTTNVTAARDVGANREPFDERPLRVANIIEDARVAGPHLRIIAVARRLVSRGISTTVIHPLQDSVDFAQRLSSARICSVAVRIGRPQRGWKGLIRYASTLIPDVLRLRRLLVRDGFSVIHCSGGAWQIKGVLAGRLAGIPVVWHLNDTSMPLAIRVVFSLVARWAAAGFIVAGRRVYDYYRLARWPKKRTLEIQAPVDTAVFDPVTVEPDSQISEISGIKVMLVANIGPLKGIQHLIEAAKILKPRFPDLSFIVVGPVYDSQKAFYKSLLVRAAELGVSESLHFLGAKKDIARALAAVDIVVCASSFEASPMAVWEAMSMARAAVSTDVGDVARFISNGESGIVVPPDAPVVLAAAIAQFAENPRLRQLCGVRARQAAIENLDVTVCSQRHADCYSYFASNESVGGVYGVSGERQADVTDWWRSKRENK